MPYTGPERRKYIRTPKPPCPKCGSEDSAVIDCDCEGIPPEYLVPPDSFTRRRRCPCGHRWYTVEQNLKRTICAVTTPETPRIL